MRESSYCFHRVLAVAILSVRPWRGWISQKRCKRYRIWYLHINLAWTPQFSANILNRNCYRLSRVSWALAQISCYPSGKSVGSQTAYSAIVTKPDFTYNTVNWKQTDWLHKLYVLKTWRSRRVQSKRWYPTNCYTSVVELQHSNALTMADDCNTRHSSLITFLQQVHVYL